MPFGFYYYDMCFVVEDWEHNIFLYLKKEYGYNLLAV